jgi:hypothetical protein
MNHTKFGRHEIAAIIRRHFGARAAVAREVGLTPQAFDCWVAGQFNNDLLEAVAKRRAKSLLAFEAAERKQCSAA